MITIFVSVPIGNEAISAMADSAMADELSDSKHAVAYDLPLCAECFWSDFEFSR